MIKKLSVWMLLVPTMVLATPANPDNLKFTDITSNSVTLTWHDNAQDERGYKIFRKDKLVSFVSKNRQSFTDRGLTASTIYNYRVKASDDFGFKLEGSISDVAHVHLFIDTDHNPDTGYSRYGIVGADILVQNGTVFTRNTAVQTAWGWEKVGESQSQLENDTMFLTFDERALGGVVLDKDATFQAFCYSTDYSTKTALHISEKLDIASISDTMKQVRFTQSSHALKNPLKGFMIWASDEENSLEYVSMFKGIVHWKDIEGSRSDGVDKIIQYSNNKLFNNKLDNKTNTHYSVENKNIKVSPIVTLFFHDANIRDSFPTDMQVSDHNNQTAVFVERIDNLVKKLAEAWDNDPRIGFIYTGIVGKWGEQLYSIEAKDAEGNDVYREMVITPEVVKALGDSFSKYFKHKKVLVRNPRYFDATYLQSHNNSYKGNIYPNHYKFGMFWDSFAWDNEINSGIIDVLKNSKSWVNQPTLGEVAFRADYAHIYCHASYPEGELNTEEKDAKSIHDTLTHESSLDYLNDYIRTVHCSALSWIGNYNADDAAEAQGAEELQKTMGYRFVLTRASYLDTVKKAGTLQVSLDIQNVGSAPFYYDWPLEVALLDKGSKQVVWSDRFKHVDIQNWQPGDDWDFDNNRYKKVAKTYTINESFTLPQALKEGEYILAISILDPASMKPAVKFAVTNYYNGGRTPLGLVGVGVEPQGNLPAFDDLQNDGLTY